MNKYGKFIVHSFILFVLLFSVTAISAADLNGTDDNGMDVLKDNGTEIVPWLLCIMKLRTQVQALI